MVILAATRPFTPVDFERMIQAGIFAEDERLELLYGRVVPMSPQDDPRALAVHDLDRQLWPIALVHGFTAWSQKPVVLPPSAVDPVGSRPEPDIAIVRSPVLRAPTAADVVLVIEVADTSRARHLDEKLPLYAAAGVPEYWVVDIRARTLLVHREPHPSIGSYGNVDTYGPSNMVVVFGETVQLKTVLPTLPASPA